MQPVVLFDMNGILVDDEDVHEAAFRQALSAAGFQLGHDEYLMFFAGRTDRDGFDSFLRSHSGAPVDFETLQESKSLFYATGIDENLETFDDAIALVRHLKNSGHKVGLITGSTAREVETVLDEIDLHEVFDVVVVAEDVKYGKPSAEPFLLAAEVLGVSPSSCVVIEDSPAGVLSARKAGMRSIAISSTHDAKELADADLVVNRASDIDDQMLVSV